MKERISEIPVVASSEQPSSVKPLTSDQLADKDFLRKMCTKELAAIVRGNNGDIKGVPAINALWDRIDGKPGQSIQVDAEIRNITVNATIRFIDPLPLIDANSKTIEHNIE